MAKKKKHPEIVNWARYPQLEQLQHKLGYFFADLELLRDAFDITSKGAEEGQETWAYKLKKGLSTWYGGEILRHAFANNSYEYGNQYWDVPEMTRAYELWRQNTSLVRTAEELGLGNIITRKAGQEITDNVLIDTFYAVIESVYEDLLKREGSETLSKEGFDTIRGIIQRLMPILKYLPQSDIPLSRMANGEEPRSDNIIDFLQQSEEFARHYLYFKWDIEDRGGKTRATLRLMQRQEDIDKELLKEENIGKEGNNPILGVSKSMINKMMSMHYFREILRTIGAGRDGYIEEIRR